jgi:chromosome segregation ATPase
MELAKRTSALNERSALADSQKAEIAVLTVQVHTLNQGLIQAFEETKAVQDCCDAAVRALSEKESEITRLTTVLEERSVLDDSQTGKIAALTMQIQTLNEQLTRSGEEARVLEEQRDTAVRVLSEKESELARMTTVLDECSVLAESQKVENAALTFEIQTLNKRFTEAGQEARALEEHRNATLRTLSEKESELGMLTSALEQRSVLVDAQKIENDALKTQVQALNERLIQAGNEARALEERHDVERNELEAVTQNLNEERGRFKNFHGRVVGLVQQLTAQRAEDEDLHRRAQKDLENRLIEQSRLLNESECELTHLRGEIEIARKAEHDLRIAIIEIEGRTNAATDNLIAEKAQLQAMLDRASGERARLAHELADLKRRQADQAKAAERVDNVPMPEHVKDIGAERARRAAGGRLPQVASS